MSNEPRSYDEFAAKSVDDLHADLGRLLPDDTDGATPPRRSDFIRRAKQWFSENQLEIGRRICDTTVVKRLRASKQPEELYRDIVGVLVGHFAGLEAHIAIIIVRVGLDKFCNDCGHKV